MRAFFTTIAATLTLVLAASGTAHADSSLLAALKGDRSPRVRAQAALALASKGDEPGVLEALIKALKDRKSIVRGSVAKALGTVGSARAFAPLCQAAADLDPFVAKWARKSALRVVTTATATTFNVRGLVARRGWQPDTITKAFQEGVLEELMSRDRFDVASYMDFRDDVEEGGSKPGVDLVLEGDVVKLTGGRKDATAHVTFKVVAMPGVVIWKGKARGKGKGGEPPPPDPYADEYTIVEEPPDAREVAVASAGRTVAASFAGAVSRKP